MTAADDFFWTFQQAQSYYQFALVNYIGFHGDRFHGVARGFGALGKRGNKLGGVALGTAAALDD